MKMKAASAGFHHSDLADAFGLLPKSLRSWLLESFKNDFDPDLFSNLKTIYGMKLQIICLLRR